MFETSRDIWECTDDDEDDDDDDDEGNLMNDHSSNGISSL